MEEPNGQSDASGVGRRWSRSALLRIAALPAIIGALVGSGALGGLLPQDPYVQAADEIGSQMVELPGFEERFGSIESDEAFRVGSSLGARAIARLPEPGLSEWLTITRQLLGDLEIDACAAAIRGPDDADEALDALKALDLDTYRRYLDIMLIAVRHELSEAAPPAPSAAEIDSALTALTVLIGADRLVEIDEVMVAPSAASDAELCSAARDLYDALAQLDAGSRGTLIRLIIPTDLAA